MTTDAELFDSLKHRIEVDPQTGARRYYNAAGQLHREDGPAIEYSTGGRCGGKMANCIGKAARQLNGATDTKSGGYMGGGSVLNGNVAAYSNSRR